MTDYAVIGAGYGDEGKGLMTDFLASEQDGEFEVVRCNGGAQAAHTVQLEDGTRHVFKHFSSGTLAGGDTLLSQHFIVNPLAFEEEAVKLAQIAKRLPSVAISHRARVTLPIDMALGQLAEIQRGVNRHGSCGWGINETIRRSMDPIFSITYGDLWLLRESGNLANRLGWIREYYVPLRVAELGITEIPDHLKPILWEDRSLRTYMEKIEFLHDNTYQFWEDSLAKQGAVIFEGAQGLGLDQRRGHFPHVTPSNTGLANIKQVASDMNCEDLEVVYVTRCYATRHGAGPLEHEGEPTGVDWSDPTNVENQWQGSLRVAPLDLDLLCYRIWSDYRTHSAIEGYYPEVRTKLSLAVTCLDQISPEGLRIVTERKLALVTERELLSLLRERLPVNGYLYTSHGPTREAVRRAGACA